MAPKTASKKPHFALAGNYPPRLHRKAAAEALTRHFFVVSPRSLERWPVPVRIINGRAYVETQELFAEAQRRVDAAALIAA